MAKNYINNKDFLQALKDYRSDVAKFPGGKRPKIPDYIGQCFMQIADRLSRKPNFASYSFRDEMVGDGIENCVLYIMNFDPDKSSNPFAYFTQIINNTFLRKIKYEKNQLYMKYKTTEQVGILDELCQLQDEDGHTKQFEIYNNITEFINNFEESRNKKKEEKKKKIGIEKFVKKELDE